MKIPPKLVRVPRNPGRAGYPPSAAKTGVPATNMLNSMNLLSNQRQIFTSNCYSQSLFGRADASDTDFYIITRFPRHTGTTTQLLTAACVLAEYNHTGTGTVKWYPNYAPGAIGTGYTLFSEGPQAGFDTLRDGVQIDCRRRARTLASSDFKATQITASPEFHLGLLRFDELLPVALGVFHRGPENNDPPALRLHPEPRECAAGAPLRGYDAALYREGIGDLVYQATQVSQTTDVLCSALGSPIFSWGVPCGIWMGSSASGADTRNIFGVNANLRLRARSPFQNATVTVRPTIVYSTGTEGDYSITITNYEEGSGSSSVDLAKASNPTLEDFSSATGTLKLNRDAESSVLVEVTFDGDLDGDSWIIIHSVVLWPEWTIPGA